MAGLLMGAFVGMLSETSLNIALPKLMQIFNLTNGSVQWLVTGYMLVIGIILPFSSLLTKWFTTRQLTIFALSTTLIGAIISALAPNFPVLLTGRMIQGLGIGIILPLMFTVTMLIFPPNKMGAAMGVNSLVIMVAPAIGPTITGIILGVASWQYIFWMFVVILLIGLLVAIKAAPNVGTITKPKVDFLSLFESIFSFASIVVGVSLASQFGWTNPMVLGVIVFGLIILGLYISRQLHLENPILNLRVFAIKEFRTGSILVMLDFAVILSSMYILPQFIQNGLLLPVAMTGILMLPGGVINALVSAVAGRLYDNIGPKLPIRLGFIVALVGAALLAIAPASAAVWFIVLAHIILMIGAPMAMSPAQTYALNSLSGPQSADGSTIMNTIQQIVGAIATAVASSLLTFGDKAANHVSSAVAFTNGSHFGFYFTVALIIIAILMSLTIKVKKD
ncbi:DHA2 family efflux MFS transporter permease subunit [Lentilactobacillus sp. Marseille-Q4993]|uniref:DHA2 family efflux MFS transporter permease subunit n=1 Tax=Lentilactobacillus sp. Marseille-Q4993 TaxID=3039492 RepID=UPI0024BC746C|nr:DHA2 family efflux MFS transporter permease subunit [Lentilactobacillus sp. Marseille-Q4993]